MRFAGTHDHVLVALSILIATAASYTALDLAGRIRACSGWRCYAWLATAAVAMGGGIWAMHFVAMLAFSLPQVEVHYHLWLTLFSLLLAILVTGLAFFVVSKWSGNVAALLASGLVMGLGVAGMHYAGMAAMRMPASVSYERLWVGLSLLVAIGASTVALWLAFRHAGWVEKLLGAAAMGVAISGMHYTAMRAASFEPLSGAAQGALDFANLDQTRLALAVTAAAFLVLSLALFAAMLDRRAVQRSAREAEALRQSEERFRLLVQSVTDYAIFMLDTEGRVSNWNAGAQRIKGYKAQEIVGQHFSRFYTEEDRATGLPKRALQTAVREGKFEAEGWRVRKDGSRFWASVVIDPIRNERGELVGFAKITRDITERKQAHDALRQAQENLFQAQKMEALGQLTGGVAHDFNNLLMAVLGNLELLRKRLPDDPAIARLLDNAVKGAERGAALTQRMLAFARRQDLKPEPVQVPELVRGMAELLERSIGPLIRIETRFPLNLPAALVDANQLELALLNLVVNARDAMPEGGVITIAACEHDVASGEVPDLARGRYVRLSISDTGEGMDEATLARAMEPFFTTKEVGKGTGLGLSMVHGLAQQSGGQVLLKSERGVGTTVDLWLPVAAALSKAASEGAGWAHDAAATHSAASLAILVVDDDPLVLANAVAMLKDLGHRPVQAGSGAEALPLLRSTDQIDLLLTDHAMPGMTGLQLARAARAERPELPLILATGYAFPAGIDHEFVKLEKPFGQRALAQAIRAALAASAAAKLVPFRPRQAVDELR